MQLRLQTRLAAASVADVCRESKFCGVGDIVAITWMPKEIADCSNDLRCEDEIRAGGGGGGGGEMAGGEIWGGDRHIPAAST
jgi:hypothetical protein